MPGTGAPGINLETCEVFESSDLTEADQHYFPVEESSESIETIHVTTSQAFGRFKGAFVDNKTVDFSDSIRNSRRKGYITWKGEENVDKEETPIKKYQRLNCEIRELMDEIKEAKDGKDHDLESGTLESLSGQVEILHKHLLELRLEEVLGKEVLETMTDPQAAAHQRLISHLSGIKSFKVEGRNSAVSNTQGSEKLNYSLLLKPENARLQSKANVNRLAARISALERMIGENQEDLSILSMETGRKTLTDAVAVLTAKTTVLEPKNLDHIEGRLAVLQQKLSREDPKGCEPVEDGDREKIKDLVKVSQKSDDWSAEVPDLIDRMEALSPLHNQAAELSKSILELESIQKQLLIQTSNNASLLKEIEKKFADNLTSIQKNFDNLQERIDAVNARKK